MILIADSGSNKTDWRLIEGCEIKKFSGKGINPVYYSSQDISSILAITFTDFKAKDKIKEIFFYGSGCKEIVAKNKVKKVINEIFNNASINVESDLLAACRSTTGNKPGIVSILGTGSNSCYYDGKQISDQIQSLGYLLGDEGSGTHIGKEIIKNYMRDLYSKETNALIFSCLGLEKSNLIPTIYNNKKPNIFLSSIAKIIEPIIDEKEIKETVKNCLREFFNSQLRRYPYKKTQSIHFCGSIGFHYKMLLLEVCKEFEFKLGTVIKKPIDGLVDYHINRFKV